MSEYVLHKTDKSYCPVCGSNVYLLIEKYSSPKEMPAFYICFICNRVAQVGAGPIREEE